MIDTYEMLNNAVNEIARQKDNQILEQLNDFISRGLLVVVQTQPIITRDYDSPIIKISQMVRLELRDREYMEQLEKENADLRHRLENIKMSLKGIPYDSV